MNPLMLILGAAVVLTACATGPESSSAPRKTDSKPAPANVSQASPYGGVWNSVLGYHGPANTMAAPGGPH